MGGQKEGLLAEERDGWLRKRWVAKERDGFLRRGMGG
jgi:hypothetical protein